MNTIYGLENVFICRLQKWKKIYGFLCLSWSKKNIKEEIKVVNLLLIWSGKEHCKLPCWHSCLNHLQLVLIDHMC